MHSLCQYANAHQITLHIEECDAICCALCNEWLESACTDPSCEYCAIRPEKPMTLLQFQVASKYILDYSKHHIIPPDLKDDFEEWDVLYEKLYSIITTNIYR